MIVQVDLSETLSIIMNGPFITRINKLRIKLGLKKVVALKYYKDGTYVSDKIKLFMDTFNYNTVRILASEDMLSTKTVYKLIYGETNIHDQEMYQRMTKTLLVLDTIHDKYIDAEIDGPTRPTLVFYPTEKEPTGPWDFRFKRLAKYFHLHNNMSNFGKRPYKYGLAPGKNNRLYCPWIDILWEEYNPEKMTALLTSPPFTKFAEFLKHQYGEDTLVRYVNGSMIMGDGYISF